MINDIKETYVLSVAAFGTADLIKKYKIHAHPVRYSYAYTPFICFRETGHLIKTIYTRDKSLTIDPHDIDYTKLSHLDSDEIFRLTSYIAHRLNLKNSELNFTEKEENEKEYLFYILENKIELPRPILLQLRQSPTYLNFFDILNENDSVIKENRLNKKKVKERLKKKQHSSKEELNINNESISYLEHPIDFDTELENYFKNEPIIEGNRVSKLLNIIKRNKNARRKKLAAFKNKYGSVYCEVCKIDDQTVLDVHHEKIKVSDMKENYETKLEDLRIVCANCHRKLHKFNMTVEEFINYNTKNNYYQ